MQQFGGSSSLVIKGCKTAAVVEALTNKGYAEVSGTNGDVQVKLVKKDAVIDILFHLREKELYYREVDIKHSDLDAYVNKRRRTVKYSTIRRELTDVKAIINWAASRRPPIDDEIIPPPTPEETDAINKETAPHLKTGNSVIPFPGVAARCGGIAIDRLAPGELVNKDDHGLFG